MRIRRVPLIQMSACLLGIGGVLAFAPGSASASSAAPPPTPSRPALIAGPLDLFFFGSGQGLPLGCNLGLSTAELVTTSTLGPAAGPVSQGIGQVNDGCASGGAAGAGWVKEGQKQVVPLAPVLNPVANPVIEGLAGAVEQADPLYATALAPADGTVYDLGATLRYFLGS